MALFQRRALSDGNVAWYRGVQGSGWMVSLRVLSTAIAFLAITLPPAWAVTAMPLQGVVTPKGTPVHLGEFYSIMPDCSLKGIDTFRVVKGPAHGKVTSVRSEVVVGFGPPSPAAACHGRQVMSTNAVYTPARGYVGQDSVVMEVLIHTGDRVIKPVTITVGP